MLISLFSSFILIESLGNDAVPLYKVSLRLVFCFFQDELLSVSIERIALVAGPKLFSYIGALRTKRQKFLVRKPSMLIKRYFEGI